VCEQFAQGRYLKARGRKSNPRPSESQVQRPKPYATRSHVHGRINKFENLKMIIVDLSAKFYLHHVLRGSDLVMGDLFSTAKLAVAATFRTFSSVINVLANGNAFALFFGLCGLRR